MHKAVWLIEESKAVACEEAKWIEVSQQEFLKLLTQHQNILYKLVDLYATDTESKKDLYQEIVLQDWKAFPSYAGRSKFCSWLYRLSLNTTSRNSSYRHC